MYFVHCADFQNSFLPNLISVWSSPINKGEPRGKITSKLRNKGHVEERCNLTGEIRTWGISEQFVLSKQKEWRLWTCNKSKICEQSYTLPTFQNGRNAFDKGSSPRKRLFDKDRSKRCLFWHTSRQEVRKYIRFQWEVNLCEFLCLCFGQGLAPLIFTKLLKIPIAFLRRINVRIIFLAQTLKEILQPKETLIFLLQNLGFVINFEKSQVTPMTKREFLGLVINLVNMTLAIPQEMVLDIQNKCMQLTASPKCTITEITKLLLEKLSFTAQAVLPGRIQYRYLEQQQIQAVREKDSYQSKTKLSQHHWKS